MPRQGSRQLEEVVAWAGALVAAKGLAVEMGVSAALAGAEAHAGAMVGAVETSPPRRGSPPYHLLKAAAQVSVRPPD